MIPIGFYRPDLAESNPGVSLTVLNAILQSDAVGVAYGPHPSIGVLSTAQALPSAPRGAISVVTRAGLYLAFIGTADKLFKVAADGSVTEIGSGYAVPAGDQWSFAQFGDYLYATNTFDGLIRYNLESGGAVAAVAGAPRGRFIFPLFNTLAMLDCDGNNRLMQTSKINDPTVWSGDASNTYQEFTEGEELIAGGELGESYAVVFQRNAIRLLTRTRDRTIFTSDLYASGIGAQGAAGVVIARGFAYFIDTDGPHRTDGASVVPIGKDKISATLIKSLASGGLTSMEGAYDPPNNRIVYRYMTNGVVDPEIFEDALAYDVLKGEWVPLSIKTAALVALASPGYSLDELDAFGPLDGLPYSLDSRAWKGGEPRLGAIDEHFKFGFMSGANLACRLETGAQRSGGAQRITGTTVLTDALGADGAAVRLGFKQKLGDAMIWGDPVLIDDNGFAPVDEAGMVMSLRLDVPAGVEWTFMRGFDGIEAGGQGWR